MYVTPASAPFLGPNWLFSFYSALFDCNHIHLLFYVDVFSGRFKAGCRAYKAILSVLKSFLWGGKCSLSDFLPPFPGGDFAYERGGDARRKFWIKPVKETDLGVAQAFFDPWKRPCYVKTQTIYVFLYFSWLNMNKWDQNPKFTPLSETTSIPTPFICGVPFPRAP